MRSTPSSRVEHFAIEQGWMVPEYRGYVLGEARRQLEAVMAQAARTDVKPQVRVAAGPAAETIAAHGAEVGADLINVTLIFMLFRWCLATVRCGSRPTTRSH